MHDLYRAAKALQRPDPGERLRAQQGDERQLLACCRPYLQDPAAVQAKLCRRSQGHRVTGRKISGGTRSERGTTTKMMVASLFGTGRAQGRDPLQECRQLLLSLQV